LKNSSWRIIGEDITLKITCSPEPLTIMADSGQLEQVVMNLATNARDAMPQGGTLSITTSPVELDEDYVSMHLPLKPGRHVQLSISDTGCGMDEATKQKIFEPFFTTKELGRGTGLGMSIIYGIIKQHNGEITVYSDRAKVLPLNLPATV
jgi:two-component system NtrC family sensor kinase